MPSFSDDLYLGGARLTTDDPNPAPGANPQQGGFGVGPLGRVYHWDVGIPVATSNTNIVTAAAIGSSLTAVLTAGTGTSFVTNGRGERVLQLDTPRAVSVTASANEAARVVTITGYDRYGQKMSQDISGLNVNTVLGTKAFWQILLVTISAASVGNISVGVTARLGIPVRVTSIVYIIAMRATATALNAVAAGTVAAADGTSPATALTGDVRGTVEPTLLDGVNRFVVSILVPAIAAGPNATRIGAYGVDQNLAAQ